MRGLRLGILAAACLAVLGNLPAYAQGSFFSTLTGVVVDTSGAVIPGATVKVVNNGTNAAVETVTGSDGGFTVPSIQGGNYSVTVSLMGFKTAVLKSVTVNAAMTANVKVTLEVGTLSENVTVVGESASVVHSSSPAISTNITGQQITSLPLT